MMQEEAYKVQYVYNAVNEYVYFIILYIEVYGPQELKELQRYVKFFRKEFQSFIQIFKGENQVKKIINFLCIATTAFCIKEETVSLSKSYEGFKKIIYEDLIKSKVVDLVLRGMFTTEDIYKNINLNNVIGIKEDVLLNMLKLSSCFYVDTDSTVCVLQFHGLIGFDNHLYKTILEYFQSYLQKVDALTFNEVNLHSRFVPSYGVQNSLIILCVFYISDVFKCKNNKVRIKKNWKIKPKNQQQISIDQLHNRCQYDVSVSRLVFLAHGPVLQNWTGEIISLNKSMGLIQCAVDIEGNYQGVFSVFFNFNALKFVCDSENLENFLNIRDTVEFDAEFCDKTTIKERYWKALQVTVTKKGLQCNKFKLQIDTEEYMESMKFKSKFNSSLKLFLMNNQSTVCGAHDLNTHNSEHFSDCNVSHIPLNFSNAITSLHLEEKEGKCDNQKGSDSKVSTSFLIDESRVENSGKINVPLGNHNETSSEADVLNFKQHIQTLSKEMLQNNGEGEYKNHVRIPNFLFSHSTFIFGEIVIITNDEGIAISLNSDEKIPVYFKTRDVFYNGSVKCIPKEGNEVLFFIPHGNKESSLYVATLVYVLDKEESSLVSGHYEWVQDFVIDYFFPKLRASICELNICDCDLSKVLPFESTAKTISMKHDENVSKCSKLIMELKDVVVFNDKTSKHFETVVRVICSHNSGVKDVKLFTYFSQLFKSGQNYKFKVSNMFRNIVKYSRNSSQGNSDALMGKVSSNGLNMNSLSLTNNCYPNLDFQASYKKLKCDKNYSNLVINRLNEYDESTYDIKHEKHVSESESASCSSPSSYVSCNSKYSSDEIFHSCDSPSGNPTSDSEVDFKSDFSQSAYQTNSTSETSCAILSREKDVSSPEITSHSKPTVHLIGIRVTGMDKEDHLSQNSKKNKMCSVNKKIPKFKYVALKQMKKHKVKIFSERNFCKYHNQLVETTARISTITDSCLLLNTENNQQTLSFPKCLIPKEIWNSMKLNSIVKITIAPHTLIQLSYILYIEFILN